MTDKAHRLENFYHDVLAAQECFYQEMERRGYSVTGDGHTKITNNDILRRQKNKKTGYTLSWTHRFVFNKQE